MTAVEAEPSRLLERPAPTAVLLYDGPPHTDEWFATRRTGITGTDLPKILDLSEYGTARHVWLDKQGLMPADDGESEAARWGTVLEGPVADEWACRTGSVIVPVGILAHVDDPWRLVSLDRQVLNCPDGDGPCALEVKTRSAFVAGKWRDDVPDDVLAQVMWGLDVTGLGHMHVAVLIGGQKLSTFRVDRDPDVIAYLRSAADALWAAVQSGTTPECAPTAALGRLLDALHPDRDGDVLVEEVTAGALRAEYVDACEAVTDAEQRKERAKVAVLDKLGSGDRLCMPGSDGPVPVFEYPRRSRTTVTAGKVRAVPELWAACEAAGVVKVSSYRQIVCRKGGDAE